MGAEPIEPEKPEPDRRAVEQRHLDRPSVLALGVMVTAIAYWATGKSGDLDPGSMRSAGFGVIICILVPAALWWRSSVYRVFAAFWTLVMMFIFFATGSFGAPPFWWPLVMVPFVSVAFFLPNPHKIILGFLKVGAAALIGTAGVLVVSANARPSPIRLLAGDPTMNVVPANTRLESSRDEFSCQDYFDGRQPTLFRAYSLSTPGPDALADTRDQLVRLDWKPRGEKMFTKTVGADSYRLEVRIDESSQVLTITGQVPSFDYC